MKLRHVAAFALGEKRWTRNVVMCGDSKDEAKFPDVAAGEVDQAQSPPGHIQFKNIKRLQICEDCWRSF
jgi:hypothetical protein